MQQLEARSVLVIGSAGREHALAWKLAQATSVETVFVAPGNGGTENNVDIGADEIDRLTQFASDRHIHLTVVGPEGPLAGGIVDAFEENGLRIFGPSQAATRLESNKAWATEFMGRHGIPHPQSQSFTDYDRALSYLSSVNPRAIVIKASGLAAGKGVILPDSREEALKTLDAMMLHEMFGEAGRRVVIQERLEGPEISVLGFSDGRTAVPLLPAQDHKRVFDGDEGPNTGGMGAIAPVTGVTPQLLEEIQRTILQPTVDGMREEGYPFRGILYAGLMLTSDGPKVLEYNARFGDPETQPLLMLLSSDLAPILRSCIEGTLRKDKVAFRSGSAACIVLTSAGYPGDYGKGQEIFGLDSIADPNVMVFHAGTIMKNNSLVTNGGRVLGVTAYGNTLSEAVNRAYTAIGLRGVHFDGMHYRRDIGQGIDI